PPSSGGVCLIQELNMMETFDVRQLGGRWSPTTLHVMAEIMRRAHCDRARYVGDPQFSTLPAQLTSKDYARQLASSIDLHRATPSAALAPEISIEAAGHDTTHFSVVDATGMAVANTYTLERR